MGLVPHYTQSGSAPAIVGTGFGLFGCGCGRSLLIAGYEPRHFLDIAVKCAACGNISSTPRLTEGAAPPPAVTLVERGAENPPATVTGGTVLISREEMERLAWLYEPRATESDSHVIGAAMLDDVEFQQGRWTGEPLERSSASYRDHALAWAVGHYRTRLTDPDWTGFADDSDMVAMTVIAAFRDLFASWAHHPLFGAMIGTAAVQGFSLHAMAMFGAAKSLASAGNRVGFVATEGTVPRIVSLQVVMGAQDQLAVAVSRFDQFEWPRGVAQTDPLAVRGAVIEAMTSVQGRINRLRPGMLVLSAGASEGAFDNLLIENIGAAVGSHGKRHRGLAAVAAIFPKVLPTGKPREVRFGYTFYPVANRAHSIGRSVRIGSRADHAGFR